MAAIVRSNVDLFWHKLGSPKRRLPRTGNEPFYYRLGLIHALRRKRRTKSIMNAADTEYAAYELGYSNGRGARG